MTQMNYLAKIATSGSILEWDGKKIAPAKEILTTDSGITFSRDVDVEGSVIANELRGSLTKLKSGKPYLEAGKNIDLQIGPEGSIRIGATIPRQTPILWKWNESDASQVSVCLDSIGLESIQKIDAAFGPALRIKFNHESTPDSPGVCVLSFNDLNLLNADSEVCRYSLRFRVADFSGKQSSWIGVGSTYLTNASVSEKYMGIGEICTVGTAGSRLFKSEMGRLQISNKTYLGPSISLTSLDGRPSFVIENEITARVSKRSIGFNVMSSHKSMYQPQETLFGIDDAQFCKEFGNFKSSWASAGLSTCGIVFVCDPAESKSYFDIDNIQVIKHPMDW